MSEPWFTIIQILSITIWPITVFAVIIIFNHNISSLIDRITNVKGPAGIEIQAEELKKAQEQDVQNPTPESNKNEDYEYIFSPEKTKIKKPSVSESIYSLQQTGDSKLNNLSFELKSKKIQLEFERIYNIILGAQIRLLELVASQKELSNKKVDQYYKKQLTKYKVFQNWTREEFLQYLVFHGMIEISDTTVKISPKGLGFLSYIKSCGYARYKII